MRPTQHLIPTLYGFSYQQQVEDAAGVSTSKASWTHAKLSTNTSIADQFLPRQTTTQVLGSQGFRGAQYNIEPQYGLYKTEKLGQSIAFLKPFHNDTISDHLLGYIKYPHDRGLLSLLHKDNAQQFFANFYHDSYSATMLFPTRAKNLHFPQLPTVTKQSIRNFRSNPLLRDSHRKVLSVALKHFGLCRVGKDIGYLPAILANPPAWLRADGESDRLLLLKMIVSLSLLENKQVAKNLAEKVGQLLAYQGMHQFANVFFNIKNDIQRELKQRAMQKVRPAPSMQEPYQMPRPSMAAVNKPLASREIPSEHIRINRDIILGNYLGTRQEYAYYEDARDPNFVYRIIPSISNAKYLTKTEEADIEGFIGLHGQESCKLSYYDVKASPNIELSKRLLAECESKTGHSAVEMLWLVRQKKFSGEPIQHIMLKKGALPANIADLITSAVHKAIQAGVIPMHLGLSNFLYDASKGEVSIIDLTQSNLSMPNDVYRKDFYSLVFDKLKQHNYTIPTPYPKVPWQEAKPELLPPLPDDRITQHAPGSFFKVNNKIALGTLLDIRHNSLFYQDAFEEDYVYEVEPDIHEGQALPKTLLLKTQAFNRVYGEGSRVPFYYNLKNPSNPQVGEHLLNELVKHDVAGRALTQKIWLFRQKKVPGESIFTLVNQGAKLPTDIGWLIVYAANEAIKKGVVPSKIELGNYFYDRRTHRVYISDLSPLYQQIPNVPDEQFNQSFELRVIKKLRQRGYISGKDNIILPWIKQPVSKPRFEHKAMPTKIKPSAVQQGVFQDGIKLLRQKLQVAKMHLDDFTKGRATAEQLMSDALRTGKETKDIADVYLPFANKIKQDVNLYAEYQQMLSIALKAMYFETLVIANDRAALLEAAALPFDHTLLIDFQIKEYVKRCQVLPMSEHIERFPEMINKVEQRMEKDPVYEQRVNDFVGYKNQ